MSHPSNTWVEAKRNKPTNQPTNRNCISNKQTNKQKNTVNRTKKNYTNSLITKNSEKNTNWIINGRQAGLR